MTRLRLEGHWEHYDKLSRKAAKALNIWEAAYVANTTFSISGILIMAEGGVQGLRKSS